MIGRGVVGGNGKKVGIGGSLQLGNYAYRVVGRVAPHVEVGEV